MQLEARPATGREPPPATLPAAAGTAERRESTDEQKGVLSRCADGDPEALSALYDRHAGLLLALIRRIVGSAEEAEEILQDVFLYVWNRACDYDPRRSSVATWLVLIARSRAIDRYRRSRGFQKVLAHVETESPSHAPPRAPATMLDAQRRRRVKAAMRDLPPEQRQVLELAYFKGMTQAEIAGSTGVPVGTVKTRTMLAMRKLRAALAPEVSDLL